MPKQQLPTKSYSMRPTPAVVLRQRMDRDFDVRYDDGRIERTHPVEQRCKKIRLNLMRWTGVRQQAESLFQSSLQMVPVTEDGDEEGEDEEHSGEEEQP